MNVLGATMLGTMKGMFLLRESLCAESVCCRDSRLRICWLLSTIVRSALWKMRKTHSGAMLVSLLRRYLKRDLFSGFFMWAGSTCKGSNWSLIRIPSNEHNLILELSFSLSYGPGSEFLDRKLQCLIRFDGLDLESVR